MGNNMLYEVVKLSDKWDATLTSYCIDDSDEMNHPPRRALIICPGGGYLMLSEREAEPIARKFSASELNTFILRYTTEPYACDFAPEIQMSLAIIHIRNNAKKYNVDPGHIYTIGFSAGGHLAASSGTLWKHPKVLDAIGDVPYGYNRPTGMILSYPVISSYEYAHRGSINRVSGYSKDADVLKTFSLEYQVDGETSPAFLWSTLNDEVVPVENTILFANALHKNNIPYELHLFPEGRHGLALGEKETWVGEESLINEHDAVWTKLALNWINDFDYSPLYYKILGNK